MTLRGRGLWQEGHLSSKKEKEEKTNNGTPHHVCAMGDMHRLGVVDGYRSMKLNLIVRRLFPKGSIIFKVCEESKISVRLVLPGF